MILMGLSFSFLTFYGTARGLIQAQQQLTIRIERPGIRFIEIFLL